MDTELLDYDIIQEKLDDEIFDTIFVDIDIAYDRFKESHVYQHVVDNLTAMYKWLMNCGITCETFIRRSSNNNVHIMVHLYQTVNFATMMIIRAILHDDPYRLGIDLRRYAYQGSGEVNRIFTAKNPGGSVSAWKNIWDYITQE